MQEFFSTLNKSDAFMLLNGLSKIGAVTGKRLLDQFNGNPLAVFQASDRELLAVQGIGQSVLSSIRDQKNAAWLKKEKENLKARQISFVSELQIPSLLREIYDCPLGLYVCGKIPEGPYLSIVGTRAPSLYGQRICRELSCNLAKRGFCIVSGMARGIDAIAHRGAIEANGKTIAFLGSGMDVIYPPEHLDLYRKISQSGAVLSEFPFGRKADRRTFPMRNRLVSGISNGVIVVESAASGGSLITANFAAEQGRLVFALPGRVDQESSAGCLELIRNGATLIRSAQDVEEELQPVIPNAQSSFAFKDESVKLEKRKIEVSMSCQEIKIFEVLKEGAILSADEICGLSGLGLPMVAASLTMLELNGFISKRADAKYEII